jgi:hypothetical protein
VEEATATSLTPTPNHLIIQGKEFGADIVRDSMPISEEALMMDASRELKRQWQSSAQHHFQQVHFA